MSERRPHWDDYLLASVMIHCNDIYQCHAVIAAVEDWQVANARDRVYLAEPTSAEQAAIALVRVMAEAALAAHDELEGTYATVSAKAILRALEGDSNE